MNKKILIGITAITFAMAVGIATASNGNSDRNGKETTRVMADTTGFIDKLNFRLKGCEIVHELRDATALKCPTNIVSALKVRKDPELHVMDMEANVQINADDVWALGYTGTGVTVAVLDTGIDTDHPELVSSIAGGEDFGYGTYEDDHGHGTHVSGIITADGVGGNPLGFAKGAAPDVKIWMAKVCDALGRCFQSDIAAAIEYVVKGPDGIINNGDEPAKIMSISLGGGGTSGENCDTDYLAQKVNWAVDNGVIAVVAAGNASDIISSPGCASKAITVGAVDRDDNRASFSGRGLALDIMAPGANIYSPIIGGYDSWTGTSMAAPHISAIVALLRQANSALTDSQIKDALYKTAKDLGTAGWDEYYGWGRVDALAAVNYVKPPNNQPIAYNQKTATNENEPVIITLTGSDPDGDPITFKLVSATTNGTIELDIDFIHNGLAAYFPNLNFGGSDSFTFAVNDGKADSNIATVSITVIKKQTLCWSGTNLYLYRMADQAKKFCKCAQGAYGYKTYKTISAAKKVWKYTDTTNNENWAATPLSLRGSITSVTCADSKAYLTNRDYWYPKQF